MWKFLLETYKHLFPKNEIVRELRNKKIYKEEFARTDRLYRSPLFKYRRLLNETPDEDRPNNEIIDVDHIFNDPFD